jgi:hypothetical protein
MKYIALFANSETEAGHQEGESQALSSSSSSSSRNNSIERNIKNDKMLARATEAATKARHDDIERNGNDKVQHAIQVHLSGEGGGAEGRKKDKKAVDTEKKGNGKQQHGKKPDNDDVYSEDEIASENMASSKKRKHEVSEKNTEISSEKKKSKKEKKDKKEKEKEEKEQSTVAPPIVEDMEKDEFFLAGNGDNEDNENGSDGKEKGFEEYRSPDSLLPQMKMDYHQIKQSVNRKKHIHHKGFSSKKSNFKKF